MEMPRNLELQAGQKELSPEQVEWVQTETSRQFAGVAYCPNADRIQKLAKDILLKRGSLMEVLDLSLDDF